MVIGGFFIMNNFTHKNTILLSFRMKRSEVRNMERVVAESNM